MPNWHDRGCIQMVATNYTIFPTKLVIDKWYAGISLLSIVYNDLLMKFQYRRKLTPRPCSPFLKQNSPHDVKGRLRGHNS